MTYPLPCEEKLVLGPDDCPPPPPHLGTKHHPAGGGIPWTAEQLATAHDAIEAEVETREEAEYDLRSCDEARFDDLAPIQLETRGTTSPVPDPQRHTRPPISQAEFWSAQTQHKNSVAAKLRMAGEADLAAKLEHCHTEYTFGVCGDCGKVGKFANRCDQFYCPECQPRLAHDRREAVEWWVTLVTQPKHIVLTLRNQPTIDKAHIQEARKWLSALRRRAFAVKGLMWWQDDATGERTPIKAWRRPAGSCHTISTTPWRGGFYSIEVTNEGRGWHLHFHLLVDADYIDSGELARQWDSVTNHNGHIVKIKDARGHDYMREVTKYAVKGVDLAKWTGPDIVQFIRAFTGVKCFGVFGTLYGARTEFAEYIAQMRTAKPKCSCGSCNVKYYSEAQFILLDIAPRFQPDTRPPPVPDNQLQLIEFGLGERNAQRL